MDDHADGNGQRRKRGRPLTVTIEVTADSQGSGCGSVIDGSAGIAIAWQSSSQPFSRLCGNVGTKTTIFHEERGGFLSHSFIFLKIQCFLRVEKEVGKGEHENAMLIVTRKDRLIYNDYFTESVIYREQ